MPKPKVAFICVHNSCRSQMAEALAKKYYSDYFEAYSAGTETKPQINQDAVRLVKEKHHIDMERTQYSKLLDELPPEKATLFCTIFIKCFLLSGHSLSDGCLIIETTVNAMMIPPVDIVLGFKG